ncbi:MAG: adenosylcobinamide amidohydrolase [Rhodocyclales bacterium]|nr:adenosylcobinamide amidohydrolase [Rhodocyclales bacterium]
MKATIMGFLHRWPALLLALPLAVSAAESAALPDEIGATLQIRRAERDGLWEKTLVVRFAGERRVLSTSDGLLTAQAAINHAAHPRLWARLGKEGKRYSEGVRDATAARLALAPTAVARMGTAADMDNLAVVTRRHGPLTVTVLATAGVRNNAQRTGVDAGTYIEDEAPAGTINIMVLSNIALSDAALARALITVTEGKTAALEDLKVPSSYTPGAQATGTGTDSIIAVSGTAAPRATYTGGHSRIGELIGKATYDAVVEALGKQDGLFLPGSKRVAELQVGPAKAAGDLRLALLHFDAVPGDIAGNRARIENAIREAVRHGADWVVTPELAETGYHFAKRIGTDWIAPFPDAWIATLAAIARDNRVALFVGVAERDAASGGLHNSVAAIDREGRILGTYRKQRVHGGAESWSQAGDGGRPPFVVDDIAVGTLICADTYAAEPAARQAAQGAAILLTPANWPPVDGMGPGDAWERRTRETGLPMVVVNRGGSEPELDFSRSESAVSLNGERLLSFQAQTGGIFYVDWDRRQRFREVRHE